MKTLQAWCALNRAPALSSKNLHTLLAAFGPPTAFFNAADADIRRAFPHLEEKKWQGWRQALQNRGAEQDIEWLSGRPDRHIIPFTDPRYPPLLRQIADPPAVLFVLGDADLLRLPQLGVVGSRQSTAGGGQICAELCRSVSQAGIIITSGMALGIDGAAHRAALDAGGKTVAVVGTGLDRVYPARHLDLAHAIAAGGAIVSEFPIGTGVRAHHFPQRNRIISGLSLGVLVIEASVKSGSLITARQAGEQGREVFAVPGSIYNPLSKGCHQLIRQGAKLTESAADILEELLPLVQASRQLLDAQEQQPPAVENVSAPAEENIAENQKQTGKAGKKSSAAAKTAAAQLPASAAPAGGAAPNQPAKESAGSAAKKPVKTAGKKAVRSKKPSAQPPAGIEQLPADSEALLQVMGYDPVRADDLIERGHLTIDKISAMLLMLVLDGAVQELPGGRYQRISQ